MVRHIVLWRLHEPRADNAAKVKALLEGLRGQIPGMRVIEVGVDFSGEADAADIALYSEFDSRDALAAYHHHPAHEAVKPFIKAARSERRVVDYETDL